MVIRMPGPTKRNGSDNWYFRRRIPDDVKAALAAIPKASHPKGWHKAEIWISLGTPERDKAKSKCVEVAALVDKQLAAFRAGPKALSLKEIEALAGIAYRDMVGITPDEPGSPAIWEHVLRLHEQHRVAGKLEKWVGPVVDRVLSKEGIVTDPDSRIRLIDATDRALVQAAGQMKRHAEGDFRKDPDADRFPTLPPPVADTVKPSDSDTSFKSLLTSWANGKGPRPQTVTAFESAIAEFETFLGHSDAGRVTPRDVVGWIEALEARGDLSVNTINSKRLAALNTVFNWGIKKLRLSSNPAKGLRSEGKTAPKVRSSSFTDAEVETVLKAAIQAPSVPGRTSPELVRAYRWVPWMQAYSGARVAEITQLRGSDFREDDGVWLYQITPEAGAVKTDRPRIVPVHPDLIAQGLREVVEANGSGPLFYSEKRISADAKTHPSKNVAGRLTTWVRSIGVDDQNVQPNHAWRHLFMTLCREHGVTEEARYFLVGHSMRDQGQGYGEARPGYLYRELSKIPAFKLRDAGSR